MSPGKRGARGRQYQQSSDRSRGSSVAARAAGGERNPGAKPSKPTAGALAPPALSPGLYIVATPIGNLADLSARARDVLMRAAIIACEDTRVTGKLLAAHAIATKMAPYHDHNAARARPRLLERLAAGEAVALVSDAGTPLISDPGYKLVAAAATAGHPVIPIPGASALLAALMVAGLPTDRFLFAGFLPNKAAARRTSLGELSRLPASLVFYETGPRLAASLADMAAILGPRPAAVARELTKLHEEVRRLPLDALAAHYAQAVQPKGEIVVVVAPPEATAPEAGAVDAQLRAALGSLSLRDAADMVATATGLSRREIYARALAIDSDD